MTEERRKNMVFVSKQQEQRAQSWVGKFVTVSYWDGKKFVTETLKVLPETINHWPQLVCRCKSGELGYFPVPEGGAK